MYLLALQNPGNRHSYSICRPNTGASYFDMEVGLRLSACHSLMLLNRCCQHRLTIGEQVLQCPITPSQSVEVAYHCSTADFKTLVLRDRWEPSCDCNAFIAVCLRTSWTRSTTNGDGCCDFTLSAPTALSPHSLGFNSLSVCRRTSWTRSTSGCRQRRWRRAGGTCTRFPPWPACTATAALSATPARYASVVVAICCQVCQSCCCNKLVPGPARSCRPFVTMSPTALCHGQLLHC